MLVISVIGVVFVVIGIVSFIKNSKISKIKPVKGLVLSSEKRNHKIKNAHVQHFESEIEFTNVYGALQTDIIEGRQPLTVGSNVQVRFNRKNNKLYLESELKKQGKSFGVAFVIMGMVVTAIGILLEASRIVDESMAAMGFGAFASGVFLFIGIWLSFVVPYKRKKNLKNCDIVEGKVVDFIESGISSRKNSRRIDVMYASIYEYSYGDMVHRYRSATASTRRGSVDIGRKVSISVNNATGEVYCLEDEKSGAFMGILPMIIGLAGFIVIGCILFL